MSTKDMGFDSALLALKKGHYVARPGWSSAVFLYGQDLLYRDRVAHPLLCKWEPYHDDLLADDWFIVDGAADGPSSSFADRLVAIERRLQRLEAPPMTGDPPGVERDNKQFRGM